MTGGAAAYYDSPLVDRYFASIWGGEDAHVGLYEGAATIRQACDAIIDRMAAMVPGLAKGGRVLDLGAGYGGAMRRLAARYPIEAICLNLSSGQNRANQARTDATPVADRVRIVAASFEAVPIARDTIDIVWSEDALLHAADFDAVAREVARVLKPGGRLIATDIFSGEGEGGAHEAALAPIAERLCLTAFRSRVDTEAALAAAGLKVLPFVPLAEHLEIHFRRVAQDLESARERLLAEGMSAADLDRIARGAGDWIRAAADGHLDWGIIRAEAPL
ncbi:SAM-dependent methyltransferase [Acuticoccus kandeliae]|uniref:SAM-dependent methyltransferase n=1 Tax=Acuticoccus kandeliae TaxID=2073160 RepID=UPI000D3EB497|nr:class I SAM-dependent methyltransferase [Acuticoccus kandeliae]